jgi:hypothetical protein
MGARKPGPQGERDISVKTIAQRMPDDLAESVVTAACVCRRAMGEALTRHSPCAPFDSGGTHSDESLGRLSPRERWRVSLRRHAPLPASAQGFGAATSPRARRSFSGGGKRGIQYSRDSSAWADKPQRTGSPVEPNDDIPRMGFLKSLALTRTHSWGPQLMHRIHAPADIVRQSDYASVRAGSTHKDRPRR